jgi:hypothetical protein
MMEITSLGLDILNLRYPIRDVIWKVGRSQEFGREVQVRHTY